MFKSNFSKRNVTGADTLSGKPIEDLANFNMDNRPIIIVNGSSRRVGVGTTVAHIQASHPGRSIEEVDATGGTVSELLRPDERLLPNHRYELRTIRGEISHGILIFSL